MLEKRDFKAYDWKHKRVMSEWKKEYNFYHALYKYAETLYDRRSEESVSFFEGNDPVAT